MSMPVDLRLLELVCSRLCHDLISPVGAVNNGAELMEEMDAAGAADVLPLIADSARTAWYRLEYFRAAWGYGGGRESWANHELKALATKLLVGAKSTLEWPGRDADPVPAARAKMLLNLVAIGRDCLARGGVITFEADRMVAAGPRATMLDGPRAALEGRTPTSELDARSVQAYVAALFASDAAMRLTVEAEADRVTVRFIPS